MWGNDPYLSDAVNDIFGVSRIERAEWPTRLDLKVAGCVERFLDVRSECHLRRLGPRYGRAVKVTVVHARVVKRGHTLRSGVMSSPHPSAERRDVEHLDRPSVGVVPFDQPLDRRQGLSCHALGKFGEQMTTFGDCRRDDGDHAMMSTTISADQYRDAWSGRTTAPYLRCLRTSNDWTVPSRVGFVARTARTDVSPAGLMNPLSIV